MDVGDRRAICVFMMGQGLERLAEFLGPGINQGTHKQLILEPELRAA